VLQRSHVSAYIVADTDWNVFEPVSNMFHGTHCFKSSTYALYCVLCGHYLS